MYNHSEFLVWPSSTQIQRDRSFSEWCSLAYIRIKIRLDLVFPGQWQVSPDAGPSGMTTRGSVSGSYRLCVLTFQYGRGRGRNRILGLRVWKGICLGPVSGRNSVGYCHDLMVSGSVVCPYCIHSKGRRSSGLLTFTVQYPFLPGHHCQWRLPGRNT